REGITMHTPLESWSMGKSVTLPLRDGRRLPEIVDTLLDQDAHQCGGHALAHRPTFEWRVHRDPFAVSLADETSPPRDDEGGRHSRVGFKGQVDGVFDVGGVDLLWERVPGQDIAHGPRLSRGVRQLTYDLRRREVHGVRAYRQRHAALVPEVLCRARHTIREHYVHG